MQAQEVTTIWGRSWESGAGAATRGTARGDSTQELGSAGIDQWGPQEAKKNAEQGKTIWEIFYGEKPLALLREYYSQRILVEGSSAKVFSDQLLHFEKFNPS